MPHAKVQHEACKGITLQHPNLTAWAEFGTWIRISLRQSPVSLTMGAVNDTASVVATVQPISGPFFDGTDSKQHG
jgi:hypothetical protein